MFCVYNCFKTHREVFEINTVKMVWFIIANGCFFMCKIDHKQPKKTLCFGYDTLEVVQVNITAIGHWLFFFFGVWNSLYFKLVLDQNMQT